MDQCSFFACALLYPGPISTFHSRSVHSLLAVVSATDGRSMAAFEAAADWGWGARFVRRPLARCAVFTFRVCVLPFQFVDHCELLLCMYTGNPLFNLQMEPYRRLSCFCIIFFVCPFNKHLLATSTHIPDSGTISPELTFLRVDKHELLLLIRLQLYSHPLCTFSIAVLGWCLFNHALNLCKFPSRTHARSQHTALFLCCSYDTTSRALAFDARYLLFSRFTLLAAQRGVFVILHDARCTLSFNP